MSAAAILGAVLGRFLGGSALPMASAIAGTGLLALLLFWATVKSRREPV
jgi:hypothetical protein